MLAGRAALAQEKTAPRLYHLGTERGKVFSQNSQVPQYGIDAAEQQGMGKPWLEKLWGDVMG